jgi:PAS domain S-box-containing protein
VLPFILDPAILAQQKSWTDAATTVGYAAGIVTAATMAALLLMQIASWRAELAVLLIVAGFALALVSDVWVVAGTVRGESLQAGLANLIYCVYGALFATAAAVRVPPARAAAAPEVDESSAYGFLPVLTILLAIVLVLGTQARQSPFHIAVAAILVLVGAVLLVVRQRAVRGELLRLHEQLAIRQADARLTELVRRSSDAIAVVNAKGFISYVSPASEAVLGAAPAALVGTQASALLGARSEAPLGAFLRDLTARHLSYAEFEAGVADVAGRLRTVQVTGSDESHNPLIDGVVLTLRDVSAQRDLEREVLEIATRERQRLCGDIHEGLGQQLTGVALLLRGAGSKALDGDALRRSLQPIIGHVNDAIASVQTLAHGLSPLDVVRGSLASALQRLAAETAARTRLDVVARNSVQGEGLDGVAADHLYRIAEDALAAATQRSGCTRIEITLGASADRLTLVVSDDGRGPGPGRDADALGLRMIGYRARLLGGSVRFDQPSAGRGRIEVTIPLKDLNGPQCDDRGAAIG